MGEGRETRPRTRRVKGSRTALKDPALRARLEAAAEAGGFESIEELVEATLDASPELLPSEDSATERYTLDDLGVQMWTEVTRIPHAERPAWFEQLLDRQQVALVCTLRERGYSTAVVARDLGIDDSKVQSMWNRWSSRLGTQVVNVRLDTIVGQLQLAAERAAEGARGKDDWATYWRIHKDMIAALQSLGIVDKAIQKVEHTHKFDDQQKAEIDALLDLERKKRVRIEEIKRAEAVVVDTPDAELLPAQKQLGMSQRFEEDE